MKIQVLRNKTIFQEESKNVYIVDLEMALEGQCQHY